MKRVLSFIGCIALILLIVPQVHAQDFGGPLSRAMETLKAAKGDPQILVLTNAPYVRPKNLDSLALLGPGRAL